MQREGTGPSPEDVQRMERMRAAGRRMQARERLIPVCWPVTTLLARTETHGVALRALWVFRDGLSFDLRLLARQDDRRMHGAFNRGAVVQFGAQAVPNLFRFGLQLADGRAVANLESSDEFLGMSAEESGGELRLSSRPGGGSGTRVDGGYELNALPPDGELTIVVAWPSVDLPETSTVVDVTGIAEAATRVIDPWPGEMPQGSLQRQPPRLRFGERPAGAFFRPVVGLDED